MDVVQLVREDFIQMVQNGSCYSGCGNGGIAFLNGSSNAGAE